MGRLEGKAAIILGAAGKDNMGQHIARRFHAEGAKVVVGGRNEGALNAFAREIGAAAVLCDITNKDQVVAAVGFAKETMGHLDIGVNSTGWGFLKPFLENTPEELRAMCELQYMGPFYFFQALVQAMESGGSIIQISSATAKILVDNHAAYMGTKAGIDHVVRAVANEFGAKGIRANSISPGVTATPMTAGARDTPGVFEAFVDSYPLGRIGTSEDIAAACTFLASDECFMTGENLQVNGGLTLRRNPTTAEIHASISRHSGRADAPAVSPR